MLSVTATTKLFRADRLEFSLKFKCYLVLWYALKIDHSHAVKKFLSNLAGIFAEPQVLQCCSQCRHSTNVVGVVCAEKTLQADSRETSLPQKESLSLNYDLHIFTFAICLWISHCRTAREFWCLLVFASVLRCGANSPWYQSSLILVLPGVAGAMLWWTTSDT